MGELQSNATTTAEYVFLHQALGLDLEAARDALCRWFLAGQNADGSWAIAPDYPGDVSTTTKAYLALKILGQAADNRTMIRAHDFVVLDSFPWDTVPEMPAEFMLMPAKAPINNYRVSPGACSTTVPLLIIYHYRPIYALPNRQATQNDFLDELWYCSPPHSKIP